MTLNLNGILWANSDNMGRKLLAKSGWSNGEGLGKDKQGTNDHIKISIKNEKRGIGLKANTRTSGTSLNQILDFENLLKTKNAKPADSVVTTAPSELRKSRPRFGRALPQDFFESNDHNKSNQIINYSIPVHSINKIEPVVNEVEIVNETPSNGNFTSSYTVWEYFAVKMSGISGRPTMASLKEFLQARDLKNNLTGNKRACADEESIPEETPRKKLKTKISNDEVVEMTVISNENMEMQDTEGEKDESQDSKRKKKKKHQQEVNENQIIEDKKDIIGKDEKRSKKSKNDQEDVKTESNTKNKEKTKKRRQHDIDNPKVIVEDDENGIVEEAQKEKSKSDKYADSKCTIKCNEKTKHQQIEDKEKVGDKNENLFVEEVKKKKRKTNQREVDVDIVMNGEEKQKEIQQYQNHRPPQINSEFEVVSGKSMLNQSFMAESIELEKSSDSDSLVKKKNKKEKKRKTDQREGEGEKQKEIQQCQNRPSQINSEFEVVSGKSMINQSTDADSLVKKKKEKKRKTDQREGDDGSVMKEDEKQKEIQQCQNYPPEINSEFEVVVGKSNPIESNKSRKSALNRSYVHEAIELPESNDVDPWTTSTIYSIKGYF